jgi:hypothetical protein
MIKLTTTTEITWLPNHQKSSFGSYYPDPLSEVYRSILSSLSSRASSEALNDACKKLKHEILDKQLSQRYYDKNSSRRTFRYELCIVSTPQSPSQN